jgi:hypothetical protein
MTKCRAGFATADLMNNYGKYHGGSGYHFHCEWYHLVVPFTMEVAEAILSVRVRW